jgi:hypothetical protein
MHARRSADSEGWAMSARQHLPIESYLEQGERILWRGRPATGIRFQASDLLVIPFSLMWGGFALFWEFMVLTQIPDQSGVWLFRLWGIPFVLVGLYMIFGRFIDDAWVRRNTEYAVTSGRVLILKGRLNQTLTALPLRTLPATALTTSNNGMGTVRFGQPAYWSRLPFNSQQLSFEFVPDAKSVLSIIESARRQVG